MAAYLTKFMITSDSLFHACTYDAPFRALDSTNNLIYQHNSVHFNGRYCVKQWSHFIGTRNDSMCMVWLHDVCSRQHLGMHQYHNYSTRRSDDSYLHVSFASDDCCNTEWLTFVQQWMSMNKLIPTLDKSALLLIGNNQQQTKYLSTFPIEIFVISKLTMQNRLGILE